MEHNDQPSEWLTFLKTTSTYSLFSNPNALDNNNFDDRLDLNPNSLASTQSYTPFSSSMSFYVIVCEYCWIEVIRRKNNLEIRVIFFFSSSWHLSRNYSFNILTFFLPTSCWNENGKILGVEYDTCKAVGFCFILCAILRWFELQNELFFWSCSS